MTDATPTSIGPYVLERELGRGAFGVVYAAHHADRPDTTFAVKTIPAHGDLDQLLVEPALLAKLKHPGIVGLDDYFVRDGKLVLALEFVPGGDLKAALDHGELFNPEQVRDMLLQLGSALAAAHAQQVVHRDLKPSNVLVDTSAGRPRFVLTDFGIGRTTDGVQAQKHAGGTYLYMAPEQLRGRPGTQSDLWALGVVAYQMLTGKLPFPGPTLAELAKQIHYADPVPPSTARGEDVPNDLEAVVLGLLRKSLAERIGSAAELLERLGHRGDTALAASAVTVTRLTGTRPAVSLDTKLDADARRARLWLVVWSALYILPNGWLNGLNYIAGLWLFHRGQVTARTRRGKWGLTLAAFAVLSGPWGVSVFNHTVAGWLAAGSLGSEWLRRQVLAAAAALGANGEMLFGLIAGVFGLVVLFIPVAASGQYAKLRRVARERALLKAALGESAAAGEVLALMREMVDTRFEDVGFHLRYAEMLYARGDYRGAAVEARLVCVQDPYHFTANLLLANAYFALGLAADCKAVCDDYLAVTGYGFEFTELRGQCR